MTQILKELLDNLETIGAEHEELYDTDVREHISDAIMSGFVRQTAGYSLPDEFGMFDADADSAVKAALAQFIERATQAAASQGLDSPQARLDAFQNPEITSSGDQQAYDEFFGHREEP